MERENIYQFSAPSDLDSLHGFVDDDGNPCVTLVMVSQGSPYSVEYLTVCAQQGNLKAFKVGDQWLTTKAWLEEHRQKTRSLVQQKLEQHQYQSGGIRILASKKKAQN